jgi:hypothetical protein
MTFSPPAHQQRTTLICGAREDHLLHFFDVPTMTKTDVNLNALGWLIVLWFYGPSSKKHQFLDI